MIITVLRGLIADSKFQQYFQFFSGVILILIFLVPVLAFFRGDESFYHVLEQNLVQMDLADIKKEMRVAEDGFERVLCRRYEEELKEQVELLAQQKGLALEDTQVLLEKKGNVWEVAEVSGKIAGKNGQESEENMKKAGNGIDKVAVEAVTIEESAEGKEEDQSHRGRALKKQICSSFALGKEQVHIWK